MTAGITRSVQGPEGRDSIPGKGKTSKSPLGPSQPHTQWVLETPFPEEKQPGRDH
jgi:hypothetical protein